MKAILFILLSGILTAQAGLVGGNAGNAVFTLIPDTTNPALPPEDPVPDAPQNFAVTPDTFKITITLTNDDSTELYRSNDNINYSLINKDVFTEYADTPIVPNSTWYYKSRTDSAGYYSEYTSALSTTTYDTSTSGQTYWYEQLTVTGDSFFVSSTGTQGGAGTKADPWDLDGLNDNWSSIGPGDFIGFERGDTLAPVYTSLSRIGLIRIPNTKSGIKNSPIFIGSWGNSSLPKPFISDQNVSVYNSIIYSGAAEWIMIRDIEIDGDIYLRGSDYTSMGLYNIIIYNVKMTGENFNFYNAFTGPQSLIPSTNDNGWAHIRSVICDRDTIINSTGNGGAINFSPYDSCIVRRCYFENSQEEAIDMAGGSDNIIENNFINGTTANGIKCHSQYRPMRNLLLAGNIILNSGANGLVFQNIKNSKVINNLVYDHYSGYLGNRDRTAPEAYFESFDSNLVANNLFGGCLQVQGYWSNTALGQGYYPAIDSITYRNTFSNNTFFEGLGDRVIRFWQGYAYPNESTYVDDARTVFFDSQADFTTQWGGKNTTNEYMRDPGFINGYWTSVTDYGNFKLSTGSSERLSGASISGYGWLYDIEGNEVNQSAPNRGPYQDY